MKPYKVDVTVKLKFNARDEQAARDQARALVEELRRQLPSEFGATVFVSVEATEAIAA